MARIHVGALRREPVLFWLFLGGFCWVIGDLFQQYAAKYIGISRGIPLSNTNQLWGLAWGVLVFGEFAGLGEPGRLMLIGGSLIMIGGAAAISFAEAPESERVSWQAAMTRECRRYGLDAARVASAAAGDDPLSAGRMGRRWWEYLVAAAAVGLPIALRPYTAAWSLFASVASGVAAGWYPARRAVRIDGVKSEFPN